MEKTFPRSDPRPFLEERSRLLLEQSELINPGIQHTTAECFEGLSREFIRGEISAEQLCIYTMTQYMANEVVLAGTDAGVNLWSFPGDFAEYVPIAPDQMSDLWSRAETHVAQNERLKRVQEKIEGHRPLFSFPVKIVRLSQKPDGEITADQIYPPVDDIDEQEK